VHCIDVYLIALNVANFKLNAYKVLKDSLAVDYLKLIHN